LLLACSGLFCWLFEIGGWALTWYERSALMADEWNSLCALIFVGAALQ
jgi:hypothetical protein